MEVPEQGSFIEEFVKASSELRQRMLAREADLLGNRIIGDYADEPERAILAGA